MTPSAQTIAQVFPFLKNNQRLVQEFSEQALLKTIPANTTMYTEGDSFIYRKGDNITGKW